MDLKNRHQIELFNYNWKNKKELQVFKAVIKMNNSEMLRSYDGDVFWTHNFQREQRTEVMVVKDKNGLCEDLKYVISLPDLCDVTFLVGPDRLPVYGVKAIMATRSRHLYQLLLSARTTPRKDAVKQSGFKKALQKIKHLISPESKSKVLTFYESDVIQKLTVEIKNFDVNVFERFMRYVHCGTVCVELNTVVGLMNAAHMYDFPELRNACWEFAIQNIRPATLTTLTSSANTYVHFKYTRMLMQKISSYVRDQPDLLQTSPELCQYDFAPPDRREYLL